MDTTTLVKMLQSFRDGSRQERLLYLAFVREVGRIGKRLYDREPSDALKHSLLRLASLLTTKPALGVE